jgi:hypothetical protein
MQKTLLAELGFQLVTQGSKKRPKTKSQNLVFENAASELGYPFANTILP